MCKSNYNAFRGVVFRMQNYEKPLIRAATRQIFFPHLLLKTAPRRRKADKSIILSTGNEVLGQGNLV